MPVSSMQMRRSSRMSFPCSKRLSTKTEILISPESVNLMAFDSKLLIIWRILTPSPMCAGAIVGSICCTNFRPLPVAISR